ncbi:uncharacterized protein BKA55DRAFT_724190 [Fusarium redolens]|uniref:Uncharacterized protein n=1 Tax=Fusarium redolens TaxID=48865 RepID=A0A9P9HKG1_FUSRE|nr:uncharacterized protein BKA55DRAFT_724190 [Fusarium redolens]KAH7259249.1 hypothetical protein BKA55DRAFT_724190 [Fusarium redolens]
MHKLGLTTFAASILATAATAASNTGPFSLYAYGPGVGGLPIFSSGDEVFVGNFSQVDDSEAAPVQFTEGDDAWHASPNTTGFAKGRDPTWSNYTFAVPGPSSSSHSVKLINSTADADNYVSDLMFYGTFVMVEENGQMASLWYATPSEIEGVYAIGWNASDAGQSDDKVVITLKRTPPSNPNPKDHMETPHAVGWTTPTATPSLGTGRVIFTAGSTIVIDSPAKEVFNAIVGFSRYSEWNTWTPRLTFTDNEALDAIELGANGILETLTDSGGDIMKIPIEIWELSYGEGQCKLAWKSKYLPWWATTIERESMGGLAAYAMKLSWVSKQLEAANVRYLDELAVFVKKVVTTKDVPAKA